MTSTFPIVVLAAAFAPLASASIIVDSAVESSNGWTTTTSWVTGAGTLSPNEASEMVVLPDSAIVSINSPSFGLTVAAGTYTVQFAVGNDSALVVLPFGFALSGKNATSSTTNSPASGSWELWTETYDFLSNDPRIGNALTWNGDFFASGGQGAFDGAGALSPDGNGFIIDFVAAPAAVPEASEAAVVCFGLTGLLFGTRRRKR